MENFWPAVIGMYLMMYCVVTSPAIVPTALMMPFEISAAYPPVPTLYA